MPGDVSSTGEEPGDDPGEDEDKESLMDLLKRSLKKNKHTLDSFTATKTDWLQMLVFLEFNPVDAHALLKDLRDAGHLYLPSGQPAGRSKAGKKGRSGPVRGGTTLEEIADDNSRPVYKRDTDERNVLKDIYMKFIKDHWDRYTSWGRVPARKQGVLLQRLQEEGQVSYQRLEKWISWAYSNEVRSVGNRKAKQAALRQRHRRRNRDRSHERGRSRDRVSQSVTPGSGRKRRKSRTSAPAAKRARRGSGTRGEDTPTRRRQRSRSSSRRRAARISVSPPTRRSRSPSKSPDSESLEDAIKKLTNEESTVTIIDSEGTQVATATSIDYEDGENDGEFWLYLKDAKEIDGDAYSFGDLSFKKSKKKTEWTCADINRSKTFKNMKKLVKYAEDNHDGEFLLAPQQVHELQHHFAYFGDQE